MILNAADYETGLRSMNELVCSTDYLEALLVLAGILKCTGSVYMPILIYAYLGA